MMRRMKKTRRIMLMISLTISFGIKTWKTWRKKSRKSKKRTKMKKIEKSTLVKETLLLKIKLKIKSRMLQKVILTTRSMTPDKRTRKNQKIKKCLMLKVKVENAMKVKLKEMRKVNKKMSPSTKTL